MFEEIGAPVGRKRWTVAVALVGQVALVGVMVVIPMLTVQQLQMPELSSVLIAPPPPPPPPPPPAPAAATAPRVAHAVTPRFDASKVYAPKVVPKNIPVLPEEAPAMASAPTIAGVEGGVAGGQVGGVLGGVLGGVIGGVPAVAPPPPPPPPPAPAAAPETPKIVRVGGQVQAAQVLTAPPPAYPVLAKDARIQGAVRLDAVIGQDGHIENLKLVSGPPLLVNAAMDAVRNWTYRPTYLNGNAVKVSTQIVVTFTLG